MEQLAKFITDEKTGLKYELCGDYYIIAGEDEPEREAIGIWGQSHLRHIQKHSKAFYSQMLSGNKLYTPTVLSHLWLKRSGFYFLLLTSSLLL